MAAKPTAPDFSKLAILKPTPAATPAPAPTPAAAVPEQATHSAPSKEPTLKERSKSVIVYLAPEGHRALRIYSAECGRPVTDLIHEALEIWAKTKGITAKLRP